jgi:glycopeptide antibiotics resistance protein
MIKLNPWKFGAVLSVTVCINYILCTVLFISFPQPSMDFLNALFHGADFRKLYAGTPFPTGWFVYALFVLAAWAYVLGAIYALVRNWLQPSAGRN